MYTDFIGFDPPSKYLILTLHVLGDQLSGEDIDFFLHITIYGKPVRFHYHLHVVTKGNNSTFNMTETLSIKISHIVSPKT